MHSWRIYCMNRRFPSKQNWHLGSHMFCITSLSWLQLKSIEVLFGKALSPVSPSPPFFFCLPSKYFHKLLASKLIAWSLWCQSVLGERDVGTPSCWSGFCYLWASFFGMQSDLCRFLKGRSSTELCILGQDLCRQSESIVWDCELENCSLGCTDFGMSQGFPGHTELAGPLSLEEKASRLCLCLWRRVRLQHALACWRELNVVTSQQCKEDIEEGTSACSWDCIARLLACCCLVLCFIVF